MSESGKKWRMLIVDDKKQNIEILMDLFKYEYKISAAVTPEKALQLAATDPVPDIILLDIIMPDMDGYEVCKVLKNDEKTKDIPIIFVTAVSEVMDETKSFEVGAADYITKPFHPPTVKARVKLHLDIKHKQELLEKFAFIDALTEIPNRRRFDEVLEKEWYRALRSDRPMSLMLLDIDHFKEYNDTYGHGRGDEALKKTARAIQDSLRRAGDFVARYGGEEFGAVLPYTDEADMKEVAEQVLVAMKNIGLEHKASPVTDHMTVSIGTVTADPNKEITPQRLLEEADKALYAAKQEGKNRYTAVKVS